MAVALSEKVAGMANDRNFQERIFTFFLQQAGSDTTQVQQWVYNNGPNNRSAYMIVCGDPSVKNTIDQIDPWTIPAGNEAVGDPGLLAAVNAQWAKIKTAAGLPSA